MKKIIALSMILSSAFVMPAKDTLNLPKNSKDLLPWYWNNQPSEERDKFEILCAELERKYRPVSNNDQPALVSYIERLWTNVNGPNTHPIMRQSFKDLIQQYTLDPKSFYELFSPPKVQRPTKAPSTYLPGSNNSNVLETSVNGSTQK
jgi:hypothetical protein